MNWAIAAVCGVLIWTVAVAAPLGILLGRAVRLADRRDAEREAAKLRHPSARPDLRLVAGGRS